MKIVRTGVLMSGGGLSVLTDQAVEQYEAERETLPVESFNSLDDLTDALSLFVNPSIAENLELPAKAGSGGSRLVLGPSVGA
jgi:hypothetical protein